MTDNTSLKAKAARAALSYVEDGMILGLGSGSTTRIFIDLLGMQVQENQLKHIVAVPTSESSAEQARNWGIPLTSLDEISYLDLAVDGADEVDPQLNLIKGLGKALLREKLVEIHARRLLVIVDESKLVQFLGQRGPLPVEITPFGAQATLRWLNTLECRAEQWFLDDGSPLVTDNGNYYVRCWFAEGIAQPYELSQLLNAWPGVVENGLFLDMATDVLVAGIQGIQVMEKAQHD